MSDLRYRRVGYVALNVTDRARSTAFHRATLGLEPNPLVDAGAFGATLLRGSASPCELALYDADAPGLRRVAFEMESPAWLERAHAQLGRLGVRTWETTAADREAFGQRFAFRFAEPSTGLVVELYVGDGTPAPPLAETPRLAEISRLGHVVVAVAEPEPIVDFFVREMNFKISDYIGRSAFLRCFPNPYHHSFAITLASENRLNHVNFLVESIDDVGRALHRVRRQGVEVVFGPGRHPPSGSVFLYFLDPDGMTFEFSTGMEEFPERGPRAPRKLPPVPESLDFWGSVRSPRTGAVGRFVLEEPVAAKAAR